MIQKQALPFPDLGPNRNPLGDRKSPVGRVTKRSNGMEGRDGGRGPPGKHLHSHPGLAQGYRPTRRWRRLYRIRLSFDPTPSKRATRGREVQISPRSAKESVNLPRSRRRAPAELEFSTPFPVPLRCPCRLIIASAGTCPVPTSPIVTIAARISRIFEGTIRACAPQPAQMSTARNMFAVMGHRSWVNLRKELLAAVCGRTRRNSSRGGRLGGNGDNEGAHRAICELQCSGSSRWSARRSRKRIALSAPA